MISAVLQLVIKNIYTYCHVPALVEPLLHDCIFLQTIVLKHYASDKFQGLDPRTPLNSFCMPLLVSIFYVATKNKNG